MSYDYVTLVLKRIPTPHQALAAHLRGYYALQRQMVKAALSGDRRDVLYAFLMEPTISSPGIGRQQVASCTATPSVPRMVTLPGSFPVPPASSQVKLWSVELFQRPPSFQTLNTVPEPAGPWSDVVP